MKNEHNPIHSVRSAWQLQEAKARFSELFREALSHGPQWVTRQGKDTVVVIPAKQYDFLIHRNKSRKPLAEFFSKSPLTGANLKFERPIDYGRAIDL